MANLALSQCDQCGNFDDHPKSHWNTGKTYHFDCLPYDLKREFVDSHPLAQQFVDAAENGKRGAELRAHIVSLNEAFNKQNGAE